MGKSKKKDCYLGLRISAEYNEKLIKRQVKAGDVGKSETARAILYKELDKKGV